MAAQTDAFEDLLGEPVGLQLKGVERVHKMGEVQVPALRGISFDVAPGEFIAVTGPSGCGKSTLLSLIGGLDRPTQGTIFASGQPLHSLKDRTLADYRLQRVGTIFQQFNLVPTMSARDNVSLPMALAGAGSGERNTRASRLLALVGLSDRVHFRPNRLSGGEQQRVSIARALGNRPGLILCDEPTGNLDTDAGNKVMDLIQEMNRKGATVVLVTHDADIAKRASRTVRLRDGLIIEDTSNATGGEQEAAPPLARPGRLGLVENARIALGNLFRRKVRTTLTAVGVAIGLATLTIIATLAAGIQDSLVKAFEVTGALNQVQTSQDFNPANHKPEDEAAIATIGSLPHVEYAFGTVQTVGTVQVGGTTAVGVGGSFPPLRSLPPNSDQYVYLGHLPSSDSANEVLLTTSDDVATLGLKESNVIGTRITYSPLYPRYSDATSGLPPATNSRALTLKIVGVGAKTAGGGNNNDSGSSPFRPVGLIIPYKTITANWEDMAKANDWKGDEFSGITAVVDDPANGDRVAKEMRDAGYPAQSGKTQLKQLFQILTFLEIGLAAFAAIALVVALLGTANTMFTAVRERTRDIGILKALGARSSDVLTMFVVEAATLGVVAGVVAILFTLLVAAIANPLINSYAHANGVPRNFSVTLLQLSPLTALAAIVLGAAACALAGALPSLRAARLNPVNSLRYE